MYMDMRPVLGIIFMIALAAAFAGCEEEQTRRTVDIMDVENGKAWFPSEGGTRTFHALEGEGFEYVEMTYYYWTSRIEYTDPDWCTVSVSGQDGAGRYTELTVTIAPNISSESRTLYIGALRDSDMVEDWIEVVQSGVGD